MRGTAPHDPQVVGTATSEPTTQVVSASSLRTPRRSLAQRLRRHLPGLLGAGMLAGIVLLCIAVPLFSREDVGAVQLDKRLAAPNMATGILGRDNLGRDILTRVLYGGRVSFLVGACSVGIAAVIGTVLGLIAGYYRGRTDNIIMRVTDILQAFPFIVLAIVAVAVIGPGIANVILVLGLSGWILFARVVRAEVMAQAARPYIESAKSLGASDARILLMHLLPNTIPSIVVVATFGFAQMVIVEATLSFLGLGVPPPTPSWGSMLADSRNYLNLAWWFPTFPGLFLMATVLSINTVGDWLRDLIDPSTARRIGR